MASSTSLPFESAFELLGHKFVGGSVAGVSTSLVLPEFDLCFDVAQGLSYALNCSKFFITHGHMDHAAGIPYIISQKAMYHHRTPEFYMLEYMIEPLKEIMNQWMKMEGHRYEINFISVKPRDRIPLKNDFFIVPFQTVHRIQSQGYTIYKREEALISFTGDTQIDFLDRSPAVKKSKILFLEVTYLDEKKTVEHARRWGHLHLTELKNRVEELECEHICVMHISRRYSPHDALRIIRKEIPEKFWNKIFIVPPYNEEMLKAKHSDRGPT